MKRVISFIVAILCLMSIVLTPFYLVTNASSTEQVPKTVDEVITRANKDMGEIFGSRYKGYYSERTSKGNLNRNAIERSLNRHKESENDPHFTIMYGNSHGREITHNGERMQAYAGWSVKGEAISTEGYPWDAGWSGNEIQNMNLIKYPWKNPQVIERYQAEHGISEKNRFNEFKNTSYPHLQNSNGTLEKAIITGLNYHYAGRQYKEFIYNNQQSHLRNRIVYDRDATPAGGEWIDYVNVIEPPTYYTWGMGRVYIQSSDRITYLGIPIAPFVLQKNDIYAHFETLPAGVAVGEQVLVGVRMNSTFTESLTTDFTWDIRSANGTSIPVVFSGHAPDPNSLRGDIQLRPNTEQIMYAVFTMPSSDVTVQFRLNRNKNRPSKEMTFDNNTISATIKLVTSLPPVTGEFDLDYNILSRQVRFPLANGADIRATLSLPTSGSGTWSWNGNAVGALNITQDASTLFRSFQVNGNPAVNEAATIITRKPTILMSLQRTDFGDDPLNKKWLNIANPRSPLSRSGNIKFDGNVDRPAVRNYQVCSTYTRGDGSSYTSCTPQTEHRTVSTSFTPGTDTRKINTFVYNGRAVVPPKTYANRIDHNQTNSLKKNLFWTSEPYQYDVIRWMARQDRDGNLYDWTAVDGQYKRTFTQQASAELTWNTTSSMAEEYKQSRDAARNMTNRRPSYDKAVFATDRPLQRYDYPIKSGYYFNPAGSYTFTIETVTYKPTRAETNDHKDLVNSVIKSFRYETDLMYINNNGKAVNLRNVELDRRGSSFDRKTAALSVDEKTGVNGETLLTVADRSTDKRVEEIQHSQSRNQGANDTHEYWKNILEGYNESGTHGSRDTYKYQEYVKTGQKMYRITERTEVTITVNDSNRNLYTHVHMPDGDYTIKAWIADIDLKSSSHAYKSTGILRGIQTLDEIKITVKGSMYDDINN